MKHIDIYTDGSSRGNPGPAGWASIVIDHQAGSVVELGGREDKATNNKMELMAVYQSLLYIEHKRLFEQVVTIYIDSSYVQKGITLWMFAWEKNGWRTKEGSEVANKEIWSELVFLVFRLKTKMKINFEKIEGHAGHFGNERADVIATSYADKKVTLLFKGTLEQYEKLYKKVTLYLKSNRDTTEGKEKSTKKSGKSGQAYSYVSCVAGAIHVDKDWATCEKRVKGQKSAKYRKVFSKMEEHALVDEYRNASRKSAK